MAVESTAVLLKAELCGAKVMKHQRRPFIVGKLSDSTQRELHSVSRYDFESVESGMANQSLSTLRSGSWSYQPSLCHPTEVDMTLTEASIRDNQSLARTVEDQLDTKKLRALTQLRK